MKGDEEMNARLLDLEKKVLYLKDLNKIGPDNSYFALTGLVNLLDEIIKYLKDREEEK